MENSSKMVHADKNLNNQTIIVETCHLQDSQLTNLAKQQLNDCQKYEQIKADYRETLLKLSEREDIHRNLLLTFQEQIKIKTNFDKFVHITEKQKDLDEIAQIFEAKSKISKNFVDNIGKIQSKFHNLGSEFNEETIVLKISECKSQIDSLEIAIAEINRHYENLKNYKFQYSDDGNFENLKQFLNDFQEKIDFFEHQFKKNEAQIQSTRKNIEFLTEKNAELHAQKDMLA